jgi:hypothetical protein
LQPFKRATGRRADTARQARWLGCTPRGLGAKDAANRTKPILHLMTHESAFATRSFDHFVLPVASLAEARARFTALGFTVAPDARHPFGTENCCIFLADTTFIEPLAIGDAALCATARAQGNAFVGNDARFRDSGALGFSQLVIKSDDAAADDEDYRASNISGGPILDFGRKFTRPDGVTGEVAFRLAFAAPQGGNLGFFACEVVKAAPGGRGALLDHANGALAAVALLATAENPLATDGFLTDFLETESEAGSEVFFQSANGALRIMTPSLYALLTGLDAPASPDLTLAALVIGVDALEPARAVLGANGIAFDEKPGWLIVPPAAGQGAAIIFQSAAP